MYGPGHREAGPQDTWIPGWDYKWNGGLGLLTVTRAYILLLQVHPIHSNGRTLTIASISGLYPPGWQALTTHVTTVLLVHAWQSKADIKTMRVFENQDLGGEKEQSGGSFVLPSLTTARFVKKTLRIRYV